jgi:pimeloyl-ACP methyl ester carboxylesterase
MSLMKRTLLLLALVAGGVVSAAGASGRQVEHSCVRGGELWFYAADGTKLVGHRFGKGTTAVILAHQSEGDLCDWLPYARRLASQGYFVFPVDFRGYGFSQARTGAAATRFAADLAAATKALRKLGKKKVFLVGASMGGIASLVAGANVMPAVDGVVSISSPARFRGMDALKSAPRLRVPVLYLAAEDDDNAGYDFSKDAEALYAATASAEKRLELLPGSLHGIALMAGSARAKALVEGFLRAR